MEERKTDETNAHQWIGSGGCGRNYQLNEDSAEAGVIKIFYDTAISRRVLQQMTERLSAGGWPLGAMPLISREFTTGHAFWITPLMGTFDAKGAIVSCHLQNQLDQHPGPDTWRLVKSLAMALASLHERGVPHGNLKPGNCFFDEDGSVLLSDWALGNMPDVEKFRFTDAVLYQSPEQLRHPAGFVAGAGYRWDVYSFGTLCFRLLTGKFPRCHETFGEIAPDSGKMVKQGIHADLVKVAQNLEREPEITWPLPAENLLEMESRRWMERCLALEPALRPGSMIEVAAGLHEVESLLKQEKGQAEQLIRLSRAERRSRFIALAAVAACFGLGAFWFLNHPRVPRPVMESKKPLPALVVASREDPVLLELNAARSTISQQREQFQVELKASQALRDRLFSWAMELDNRHVPPLDGRVLRLKELETQLSEFLTRHGKETRLASELAHVSLQLAEIALSTGDSSAARSRLSAAKALWDQLPENPDIDRRLARATLRLAILLHGQGDPTTAAALLAARGALEAVLQADPASEEIQRQLATVDFHQGQLLASQGNDAAAVEQLMRATESLRRLADRRPDAAILRSELVECFLSSAKVLDAMGSLGDARDVRSLAAQQLVQALLSHPDDVNLQLALASCHSAMAESALLFGDLTSAAATSAEAIRILDQCLATTPTHLEANTRKASQLGFSAGIQRDRGQTESALKGYQNAVEMLCELHLAHPQDELISFNLVLLWWQQAKMIGISGHRDQEIAQLQKAADLLKSSDPNSEQTLRSGAYLHGDLGHAHQLMKKNELAAQSFQVAISLWEKLLAAHPKSQEYADGLAWCRQRLADLK